METNLLQDACVPPSDSALMQALMQLQSPSDSVNAMTFGVEDDRGQLYRVVRTSGLCETVRMFESARGLGFDIVNARSSAVPTLHKVLRWRGQGCN